MGSRIAQAKACGYQNSVSHDTMQYMRLSPLQKHILSVCYSNKGKVPRAPFHKFYEGREARPKDLVDTVTKALERLIDKGLLTGLGVRTPKKLYIKEVRLTPLGRKLAKKLQGEQQKLPLK
jgi:DNA-binding MarR family transcriptional regulator